MSGVSLKLLCQVSGEYELAECSVRLFWISFVDRAKRGLDWPWWPLCKPYPRLFGTQFDMILQNINIIQYSMEIPPLNAKNVFKFVYVTFLFAVLFWLTVSVLCTYLFLRSVGQTVCSTRSLVVLVVPCLQGLSRSIYCTSKAGVKTVAV